MSTTRYTKEVLEEAVSNSNSLAGVLRYLDLRQAGGTQHHINNKIKKYQIDTSHFKGMAWNKGLTSLKKKDAIDILVRSPEGSPRTKRRQLCRAMLESGIQYCCKLCGQGDIWNSHPLTLDIDHEDGDWLNNLISNVRFLCPNCHAQQVDTNRPHKYRLS